MRVQNDDESIREFADLSDLTFGEKVKFVLAIAAALAVIICLGAIAIMIVAIGVTVLMICAIARKIRHMFRRK